MTEEKKEKNNFKDYNLKFELLRGLYYSGYEKPTNVQKKILNDLFNSKDILINSPSLTGKKISSITKSDNSLKERIFLLIISKTRPGVPITIWTPLDNSFISSFNVPPSKAYTLIFIYFEISLYKFLIFKADSLVWHRTKH